MLNLKESKLNWVLLSLAITLPALTYGQSESSDVAPCSSIIADVSYYWQLDSLPSNGYRSLVKRYLLNCRVDTVSKEYILEKLGKPTGIAEGHDYWTLEYRYYDWKFIDHAKYRSGYGFDAILLIIDKKTNLLERIGHQTGEY